MTTPTHIPIGQYDRGRSSTDLIVPSSQVTLVFVKWTETNQPTVLRELSFIQVSSPQVREAS